jgi:hypothetical protein
MLVCFVHICNKTEYMNLLIIIFMSILDLTLNIQILEESQIKISRS